MSLRLAALFSVDFIDNIDLVKNASEKYFYTQYGQDFLCITTLKYVGVFLDVGANHLCYINKTYALEPRGWTGLSFEP